MALGRHRGHRLTVIGWWSSKSGRRRGGSILAMATRLVQINMKARDDSALGGFWAAALGWAVSSEEPGVTNL